jgi:peptidyl-prolyl cis-trans isomerase D
MPAVFQMKPDEMRVIEGPDFVGVLRLDSVQPATVDSPDAKAMRAALSDQISQALAQDAFQLFSNALIAEAGITLNDAAINAVHAQIQ